MSALKKLEAVFGVATAVLGIAAAIQMLNADMETMRRLGRTFPIWQELIGALLLYAVPGLIVALGSYLQIYRSRSGSFLMTVIGSLFLVTVFILFASVPVYLTPSLTFWIDFSVALLALATMVLSLVVRYRDAN